MEINDSFSENQISNYTDVNSFFSRLLSQFGNMGYENARKSFYAALGSYSRLFDDIFLIRCASNEWVYSPANPINNNKEFRTLLHLRFCADLYEFSNLIFRQNKKQFDYNTDMDYDRSYFKILGYSRLVDFKALYLKHESDLSKLSMFASPRELLDYVYHTCFLFGGLWRDESVKIFSDTYYANQSVEKKFYNIQNELAVCMSTFGVFRPPMYVEIIMPKHEDDVPRSIEDTLLYYNIKFGKISPSEIKGWNLNEPLNRDYHKVASTKLQQPIKYGQHKPFIENLKERLNHNQSTDILMYGIKGDGKSSAGLGVGYAADDNFTVDNIVFSMEEYLDTIQTLPPKSVIVFDETGTQSSGMSSRNFMSNKNKNVVDIWQMARTKQVCTIAITLDAGRIDNRIRETFRYHMSPLMKLSNEQTKGHGLGIVCEVREIIKAKTAEGSETLFDFKSSRPNGVSWLSIPLAPKKLIYQYELKRDMVLTETMESAMMQEPLKRPVGRPRKNRAE